MRPFALIVAGALAWTACVADGPPATPTSPAAPTAGQTDAAPSVQATQASQPAGTMSWSRVADIPTPRSEVAATLFMGRIYVIGGFGGPRVVERYDPSLDRWERQPDLPIGVDHPMAAALNGPNAGVFVMGGNSGGAATARAFHLAPDASAWEEIAPMPGARAAGAAVARAGGGPTDLLSPQIYVVGGASSAELQASTFMYDSLLKRWETLADMPTPRDHLAAAWLDDRLCAVGGRTLSMTRNLAALECFVPPSPSAASGTWERLVVAPTARGGVGAAVVGDRLFFIGGEQPQGTFKEVEIYDRVAKAWSRGPDLPTPRHGIGVVAFDGKIYVLTGGPTPGGSQTAVCEVLTLR